MPNSLTERQLGTNLYIDDEEEELRTNEQIKKDLEEVDDVFAANVWSVGLVGGEDNQDKKGDPDQPPPEEEWLNTSSEEESKVDQSDPGYDIS